jgi:hypothetical protein
MMFRLLIALKAKAPHVIEYPLIYGSIMLSVPCLISEGASVSFKCLLTQSHIPFCFGESGYE